MSPEDAPAVAPRTLTNVACPNCGCDYATAADLRAWKDNPDEHERLVVKLTEVRRRVEVLMHEWRMNGVWMTPEACADALEALREVLL